MTDVEFLQIAGRARILRLRIAALLADANNGNVDLRDNAEAIYRNAELLFDVEDNLAEELTAGLEILT